MAERSGTIAEPTDSIRSTYQELLEARRQTFERKSWWVARIADARLLVFCIAFLVAFLIWYERISSPLWLLPPFVAFVILALIHEPTKRSTDRADRARAFYERGLARLAGQWAGSGTRGIEYLNLDHPFAADLDLFGPGSLFERLCSARTRAGESTLASWLVAPAPIEVIAERHAAIDELRPRLDLREDLDIQGSAIRAGTDPSALADWGRSARAHTGPGVVIAAAIVAIAGSAAVFVWVYFWFALGINLTFIVVVALAAGGLFELALAGRNRRILKTLDRRTSDLLILAGLLERLEREPFTAPALARLKDALVTVHIPASTAIHQLARLLQLLDSRRNQFFFPIAVLWVWTTQIAYQIDLWRAAWGPKVAGWITAVGELEALLALAAYSAENPDDPFPELVPGPATFDAKSLGHPLIDRASCIRNDIALGGTTRSLLVSGSNMSGKSTLLRTVGVNTVLAMAGAPVRAGSLTISPLALGGTLRIQDSLQAGRSRFYAEIERVRLLVQISSGPIPLLFLLDELFHGTNSHDRCLGAESLIRGLIDRGSIGLVTTHDLALASAAERLAPRVENVHFEDRLEDGKMLFDYRMKPGIVQHSNALALMRAIGLDV